MDDNEMRERFFGNYVRADGPILIVNSKTQGLRFLNSTHIISIRLTSHTVYAVEVKMVGDEGNKSFSFGGFGQDRDLAEEFMGVILSRWLGCFQHAKRPSK